jgi:TetR/AcrR family transcriptional regulator, regulator of biofilm formation and stress response
MQHTDIPVEDPTPQLAPTARRLLDAAVRVLDRDGYRGLTYEAIGREAGENGALIRYYFGGKAGLISAAVDFVLYSEATELVAILGEAPAGKERRETLFRKHRRVVTEIPTYQRFYELIPNVLRDPDLRPKLRDLMRWYRALDAWALRGEDADPPDDARTERLSYLTVAVLDGLALQVQAEPELDVGPIFDLWEEFVLEYLQRA